MGIRYESLSTNRRISTSSPTSQHQPPILVWCLRPLLSHVSFYVCFRIYDKHKQGYITIEVLKEILREIDAELTEEELDEIVTEVDEDGSGTVDFQEFMAMMTG